MSPSSWVPTSRRPRSITLKTIIDDDQTREWAITAARAADSKQGTDVVVLHVAEVLALCEWFVIVSASNDRQVKAVCDEVEHQIREVGGPKPKRVEGMAEREWVLLDFGDVVVHVFQQEARDFYDLERLWADVPRLEWDSDAA